MECSISLRVHSFAFDCMGTVGMKRGINYLASFPSPHAKRVLRVGLGTRLLTTLGSGDENSMLGWIFNANKFLSVSADHFWVKFLSTICGVLHKSPYVDNHCHCSQLQDPYIGTGIEGIMHGWIDFVPYR